MPRLSSRLQPEYGREHRERRCRKQTHPIPCLHGRPLWGLECVLKYRLSAKNKLKVLYPIVYQNCDSFSYKRDCGRSYMAGLINHHHQKELPKFKIKNSYRSFRVSIFSIFHKQLYVNCLQNRPNRMSIPSISTGNIMQIVTQSQ